MNTILIKCANEYEANIIADMFSNETFIPLVQDDMDVDTLECNYIEEDGDYIVNINT